jgi:hypothetical protein
VQTYFFVWSSQANKICSLGKPSQSKPTKFGRLVKASQSKPEKYLGLAEV